MFIGGIAIDAHPAGRVKVCRMPIRYQLTGVVALWHRCFVVGATTHRRSSKVSEFVASTASHRSRHDAIRAERLGRSYQKGNNMEEINALQSAVKPDLYDIDVERLDLTPQAREAGIPVPMRMTGPVYDLVINVESSRDADHLIGNRKRSIVKGLVTMMCRKGLRMNGHLGFTAVMPDESSADYCRLAASLQDDGNGHQCITIGRPASMH